MRRIRWRGTSHSWKNETWDIARASLSDGQPLGYCASNLFADCGVVKGDCVYVVTIMDEMLYLLSKLRVLRVCCVHGAAAILNTEPKDLWTARDHVVADLAAPAAFDCAVPYAVAKRLRPVSGNALLPPRFSTDRPDKLDRQTLRGVRKRTTSSATPLDRLLPDMLPRELAVRQTRSLRNTSRQS